MTFYGFAYVIVSAVIRMLFKVRVAGAENVPKDGGAILAVNHKSNWDVIAVGTTCGRKLSFMAKSEMFDTKLKSKFFSALGAFPVKRGMGDIGAVKTSLAILKQGNMMLMFPEGKRVRGGKRVRAKTGAVMIANRSEVPVIPVNISTEYKFRKPLTVTYGEPIYYKKSDFGKISSENLQELSDKLLDRIMEIGV